MTATRPLDLTQLHLGRGAHIPNDENRMCVMEAVAYIAGEPWTDSPVCASPAIAAFLRRWNDDLDDNGRQALKQYIPRLIGSKGTQTQEDQRAWMAADWLVHDSLPLWLRAGGFSKDDDHKGLEVNVALNVPWQPDDLDPADRQIDGFEALAVTIEPPDRERLQLEVYEGPYPDIWPLLARQKKSRTDMLGLGPTIAARLGKAAKLAEADLVKHWSGGRDKPIQVQFGADPVVSGLVMPKRWDYDRDAPYGDTEGEE